MPDFCGMRNLANNACVVCDEPVYNTICALCLTDNVELWLERKKLSMTRDFRRQVRSFLDSLKRKSTMRCTSCRSEAIATCHMCFLENIGGWLASKDKTLAVDFVKNFNADFTGKAFGREVYA